MIGSDVSGQQKYTYNLDEQLITATSTPLLPLPQVEESTSEDTVIRRIMETFPDAPIMVAVARCESGLDPTADRGNLGVDVGLFQINQVHLSNLTRLGFDRTDLEDNLTYARILYDESGLNPWFMSRDCWAPYL